MSQIKAPCLPQHASNGEARSKALKERQQDIEIDLNLVPGIPFAKNIPFDQRFGLDMALKVGKAAARQLENHAKLDLSNLGDFFHDKLKAGLKSWLEQPEDIHPSEWFSKIKTEIRSGLGEHRAEELDDFLNLYQSFSCPKVSQSFLEDGPFAEQRLSGLNPMLIARVELQDPKHSTFKAALERGELQPESDDQCSYYVCDYHILKDTPCSQGQVLHAPKAYFAVQQQQLMPIAIQLNEDDTKLWQPHEQWAWTMAKTAVQSADHHHHELVHHLAQAHLFMEAITLSCERQLSSEHPLHVLLKPHLHDTLDINETARKNLISPGGQVEELMSPTHEGDLQIIAKGYESIDLSILNFPLDLKLRGMEETAFPYAYGEDGLSIWQCIASFASSYVDLYYLRDEDMTEDIELHNFFNELRSEQGCRLKNISPPSNLEDLKTFLSAVIFRGSAFHAVVNYGQYPYGGFSPNMPASLSSSAPEAGQHYEERDWLGMLPSLDRSLEWVNLMFQLSHIYGTTLGQGLDEHLSDPRAGELLQTFQTELANTEELIRDRNSKRKTPFELLLPSRIPASIFI